MVCLLQLSEQLHFNWWVQAQVRVVLICDITTATQWELISLTLKTTMRYWDLALVTYCNLDQTTRRGVICWSDIALCAHVCARVLKDFFCWFFFTLFTLHVALVMLVKCKQWCFFFQAFSAFDRWLFGVCSSVVSSSHKWMYWTQTGEAICNTHFNEKKKWCQGKQTSSNVCLCFRDYPFCSMGSICI